MNRERIRASVAKDVRIPCSTGSQHSPQERPPHGHGEADVGTVRTGVVEEVYEAARCRVPHAMRARIGRPRRAEASPEPSPELAEWVAAGPAGPERATQELSTSFSAPGGRAAAFFCPVQNVYVVVKRVSRGATRS